MTHLVGQHLFFENLVPFCGPIPLRLSTADFRGIAAIIVSQQVSKASATAIFNRLQMSIDPLTAEAFIGAGETVWREAGLSGPKQRTLKAIAEAECAGDIELGGLCDLSATEAEARMTSIRGIGPWTAEIYLMFCAGHPDIFPAGDLALQEAIRLAMKLDNRPGEKACRVISSDWTPFRSVAARILWDYYRVIKGDAMPV